MIAVVTVNKAINNCYENMILLCLLYVMFKSSFKVPRSFHKLLVVVEVVFILF